MASAQCLSFSIIRSARLMKIGKLFGPRNTWNGLHQGLFKTKITKPLLSVLKRHCVRQPFSSYHRDGRGGLATPRLTNFFNPLVVVL